MTELETLTRAQMYIEKMANGINPLDGTAVKDDDLLNNVRISRCLFFVSDTLKKLIDNGGTVSAHAPRTAKTDFSITADELLKFPYSQTPIAVSEITKRVNNLTDTDNKRKFSHRMVTDWLIATDFLFETKDNEGKSCKRPTENGMNLGISVVEKTGQYGTPYQVVVYDINAQRFILDNVFAILDYHKSNRSKSGHSSQSMPWTLEDEQMLYDLYMHNIPTEQIARSLNRSEGAVKSRLTKLGLG